MADTECENVPNRKESNASPFVGRDAGSWVHQISIGGGVAAAHALGASQLSNNCSELSDRADVGSTVTLHARAMECRNMVLLSAFFTVYMVFRSGCLIVLPLSCKKLLQSQLAGEEYSALYQLPLALWFIMDVLLAVPNAMFMRKCGRAAGFALGGSCALVASLGAFATLKFLHHLPWLCFFMLLVCVMPMSMIGMGEFVRYAAAEACLDDSRRSRSVTMVLSGGAFASWVGPFSSTFVTYLAGGPGGDCVLCAYPYFFLATAFFAVVGIFAAKSIRLPEATGAQPQSVVPVPLLRIIRRPAVSLAIVSQVMVQFVMVVVMSATPLAMEEFLGGIRKGDFLISSCVVAHVVAMFLPGLITGDIISKVGVFPVMLTGLVILGASNIVLICNESVASFFVGLVLLGIGFNCAFASGTLLLIRSHTLEERPRVTSLNETLRFLANAVAVLLSSAVHWKVLNWVSLACVITMFPILALWGRVRAA